MASVLLLQGQIAAVARMLVGAARQPPGASSAWARMRSGDDGVDDVE